MTLFGRVRDVHMWNEPDSTPNPPEYCPSVKRLEPHRRYSKADATACAERRRGDWSVWPCDLCHAWHVGHAGRAQRLAEKRRKDQEAFIAWRDTQTANRLPEEKPIA